MNNVFREILLITPLRVCQRGKSLYYNKRICGKPFFHTSKLPTRIKGGGPFGSERLLRPKMCLPKISVQSTSVSSLSKFCRRGEISLNIYSHYLDNIQTYQKILFISIYNLLKFVNLCLTLENKHSENYTKKIRSARRC